MSKRVYELAKELGVESKQVLTRLRESGVEIRDHLAQMTKEQEDKARKLFETPRAGEVQVKKMEGGRVVRRRAGESASAAPAQKPAAAAQVEEAAPAVEPVPETAAPAVEASVAEAAPSVVDAQAVSPEAAASVQAPVAEVPALSPAVAAPVAAPVEAHPAQTAAPAAPAVPPPPAAEASKAAPVTVRPAEGAPRDALKQLAEQPDKKTKLKRLVYDRRSDVLSIRDFMSTPEEEAERTEQQQRPTSRRRKTVQRRGRPQKTMLTMPKEQKRNIRIEGEAITVADLAHAMGVKAGELIKKLMQNGVMAGMTQPLDLDTAGLMAGEYGFTLEKVGFDPAVYLKEQPDGELEMKGRPPVVTIMGHVDHGKTTLLDRIRSAHVAEQEAGGITQHIGAYQVKTAGGDVITFIDTPGHEAFTQMRARGAQVTDIVILVVAADDGVMAQTKEAIAHARDGGAPIIVAVNKIDKPDANPERVRRELSDEGLVPEEWGGPNIFCEISAKQNLGIDNLLEMILLQAQVLELKANPDKAGRGVVLESRLDPRLGPVATVLVSGGTLKVGDAIVAGLAHGRIRVMTDDKGKPVTEAAPATPVRIAGLNLVPNAGDAFVAMADEKKAREVAEFQMEQMRRAAQAGSANRVSLEDFFSKVQAGEVKELKVILRADVQGSLSPLVDSVTKLKHPEITLRVLHSAVGAVAESDVNLAIASNAVVVGFNVGVDPKAQHLAEQEKVDIRRYSIIYDVIDDLKRAMEGLLTPKLVAKQVGRAEVRQVFSVSKVGKIAGSLCTSGTIKRTMEVRVVRGKETLFTGKLSSLKRFKDDVREVKAGMECGIGIDGYEGVEAGDVLEFYEYETVRETLVTSG